MLKFDFVQAESQAIIFKSLVKSGRLSEAERTVLDCNDDGTRAKFQSYLLKRLWAVRTKLVGSQRITLEFADAHINTAGAVEEFCRAQFDLDCEDGQRQFRKLLAVDGDDSDPEQDQDGGAYF